MSSVLFQMGGTSKRKKLTETRSLETRSLDQQAVDELIAEMNTDSTVSSYNLLSIPLIVNATVSSKGSDSTGKAAPLLAASLAPELIGLRDDDERFKADINTRPEDLSVRSDAYKLVRIEDFGAAMLRGMGWEENLEVKKAEEKLVARDARLGLGALSKPPDMKNNKKSSKEQDIVNKKGWEKKALEKIKNQSLNNEDLVWLKDKLNAGKRGSVVATRGVPGLDRIRIRLELSGKCVEIKRSDAVLLSEEELTSNPYIGAKPEIAENTETETQFFGLKSEDNERGHQNNEKSNNSYSNSYRSDKMRKDNDSYSRKEGDERGRNNNKSNNSSQSKYDNDKYDDNESNSNDNYDRSSSSGNNNNNDRNDRNDRKDSDRYDDKNYHNRTEKSHSNSNNGHNDRKYSDRNDDDYNDKKHDNNNNDDDNSSDDYDSKKSDKKDKKRNEDRDDKKDRKKDKGKKKDKDKDREKDRDKERHRDKDRGRDEGSSRKRIYDDDDNDDFYSNKNKNKNDSYDSNRSNNNDDDKKKSSSCSSNNNNNNNSSSNNNNNDNEPSWLVTGIRVRNILRSASSYLQEGSVIDVPSRGIATIKLNSGKVIEGVKEKYLETVLPVIGGLCTVLVGTYCGQSGVLIEKQTEDSMALVQLEDDLEIIMISMRHIASRM